MRWPSVGVLLCLGIPGVAAATHVSDELAAGSQQPTSNNPRTGYVSNRLGGVVDLAEQWDLRGDATLTYDEPTPRQPGSAFPSSGGLIPLFDLGVDWSPSDHWSFGAELDLSPSSGQSADAPLQIAVDGGTVSADADVRSVSSSFGGVFSVGYDTAGESNAETAVSSSVNVSRLQTSQRIAAIANKSLNDLYAVFSALCRKPVTARLKGCQALAGKPQELTQAKVAVSATETLFEDTDLTLGFAYYFYDQDPTQVGYYTLTNAGRTRTSTFGEGLAIAPLQFTLRPEVSQRFFGFRATVYYQYGQYVPGQGDAHGAGLKLEYKFNRAFKLWVSASAERDVDGSANVTVSSSLALGARYRF